MTRKSVVVLTYGILLLLCCFAQEQEPHTPSIEFKIGGTLQTVHGVNWNKGLHYSASRNFAEIRGEIFAEKSYAFISGQAEYNYRNPQRTGFRLNEAYYRYSGEIWDLTLGRQLLTWGQADGFAVTNMLTAKDSSEFVGVSEEAAKLNLASDAIRLRFFHNIFTFEAVAIPFFTPNKLPLFCFEDEKKVNLFTVDLPQSIDINGDAVNVFYKKNNAEKPKMVVDSEIAARFSFFLPAIDFSISGFYGWDKMPDFVKTGTLYIKSVYPHKPDYISLTLTEKYYRIFMAGFDAAIPAGPLVVRLEAAWIGGKKFSQKEELPVDDKKKFSKTDNPLALRVNFNPSIIKNQLLMLIGIDWSYGTWFFSGQYFEDLVPDHKGDLARQMHQGFVNLNFSKTFLRETLKLSASGTVDVNYGSTFSTCSLNYALTDNMHIAIGGDLYTNGYDKKGKFALKENISSIWFRGKFIW